MTPATNYGTNCTIQWSLSVQSFMHLLVWSIPRERISCFLTHDSCWMSKPYIRYLLYLRLGPRPALPSPCFCEIRDIITLHVDVLHISSIYGPRPSSFFCYFVIAYPVWPPQFPIQAIFRQVYLYNLGSEVWVIHTTRYERAARLHFNV